MPSTIFVQQNTALIHNGIVIKVYFISRDHIFLVESGVNASNNNCEPLFLSLRREPYETHEVQGSWEKVPGDGSV